jgi:hypothetical protein
MTGVFRAGRAHDIAIAPFRTPAGWMLLMADEQSDQLRLLAPGGKNIYTAGAELARPTPPAWTLRFTPETRPTELVIEESGTGLRFAAKRTPIGMEPISFQNGAIRLEGSLFPPFASGLAGTFDCARARQ